MTDEVWGKLRDLNRPPGELAMTAYLAAPKPMSTGIAKLDQLLGGGLTRGLTVVGGPPSAGKSVLGCQCSAMLAASGRKVVYASYEMSWDVVQLRCASAWSVTKESQKEGAVQISWSSIVNGTERKNRPEYEGKSRRQLSRYLVGDLMDPITNTLTLWDEGPGRNLAVVTGGDSVSDLVKTVSMFSGDNPPVLVVDYLQIVPTETEGEQKEYSRVTEVVNALQAYSMSEGAGNVLAISSTRNLTHADYKDGPDMSWFRGSGYIGYAAEQAVMLVPDYESTSNGRELSRDANGAINGRMVVVKNKSGASGVSIATKLRGDCNWIY